MQYLGHLPESDPLFNYLKYEIFPQVNCHAEDGIRVFKTQASNDVYFYEDRRTCTRVVGKFFYAPEKNNFAQAQRRLDREFRNNIEVRSYLDGVHYAAKALGRYDAMNCLLVVEYCYGEPLDSVIIRSIVNHDHELLYEKLRALAWFMAELHNRSARPEQVKFDGVCTYYDCVLQALNGVADHAQLDHLRYLRDRWREDPIMYQDQEVLVHGDATPSNFFFGDNMHVITFDLERVMRTDRVFDVGRLTAELQHFFMRTTGNKYDAEPFIGHFLWEYACHFPDRDQAFASVNARVPFYMGTNLLRIARNGYLDMDYRHKLVSEAFECLKR